MKLLKYFLPLFMICISAFAQVPPMQRNTFTTNTPSATFGPATLIGNFSGTATGLTNLTVNTIIISNQNSDMFCYSNTAAIPDSTTVSNTFIWGGTNPLVSVVYTTAGSAGASVGARFQVKGIIDNSFAAPGLIGQVIDGGKGSGAAVALTSGSSANITSIVLTPGDWELSWCCYFQPAATTSVTGMQAGLNTATGTLPNITGNQPVPYGSMTYAAMVPNMSSVPITLTSGVYSFNLSSPSTVYLVANSTFSISTMGAYGWIHARRVFH